jgi:hypothetical protein
LNESAILARRPSAGDRGREHQRPVIHTVRERRPVAALGRHVTWVWVQEVSPDSAPFAHRRAPNGSAELVCVLGAVPRVLGPQTGPLIDVLGPGTTVVGVRLRPGAHETIP